MSVMDRIIYEQPLCEQIRLCLRLEQVFNAIDALQRAPSEYSTACVVHNIVDLLILTDRSDLKTKLIKTLTRLQGRLSPLQQLSEIDQELLHSLLAELNRLQDFLINLQGRIAQSLRSHELLNELKQFHFMLGGTTTSMDTPAYHYWLQQSVENQQAEIAQWLEEMMPLKAVVTTILKITRESKTATPRIAHGGFYFESFDHKNDIRLLRIIVAKDILAYPEVSVGSHRVNIHWYHPKTTQRPTPVDHDIHFELTCCS